MSEPNVDYEILVLGAGISGLVFARFYLDIHSGSRLAILEEDSSVGGVWSSARLYDEFWTQSGRRMLGFSDVPITLPPDTPSFYGCIEAKRVTNYLEDYTKNHVYEGTSLESRIYFGYRVEKTEKFYHGWNVSARDLRGGLREFRSSRIVVATGLTSSPHMPIFPDSRENFKSPIYHHKHFGKVSKNLLETDECKNVVVLGAGKSATDMVYESVKKSKNVSWIIRRNGEGPALFFSAPGGRRYENSTEAGATRLSALFSPSSFMPSLCLSRLIHRTTIGINYLHSKIVKGDQSCRDAAGYRSRKGATESFKHLEPNTSAFWCSGPLGLAQHDDFWDTLARNVRILRNNISSMKAHSIVLDDDSEIATDVLLCGTGWESKYDFFPKEQVCSLGLPHLPMDDLPEHAKLWKTLLETADRQVLSDFPILEHPPQYKKSDVVTTNIRLYNCIAPLEDPSVVFLGRAHLSNSFRTAEVQAIWATAYFDGNVRIPSRAQAQQDIAYMNALSKRRYPSHGAAGDYLFFELIWYTDKLLAEVGLKSHRKSWWADWVEPCLATDLKGMTKEYREKFSS